MITIAEIRSELTTSVRLNPRGKALERGDSWEGDGGRYNGYVTIPEKYSWCFRYDHEWSEFKGIPYNEVSECTYSAYTKDRGIMVGFDTLHVGDTEAYWTKERTLTVADEWADKIADQIFRMLPVEETTPTATVQQLIEFLSKFDPSAPVYFLREFNKTMPVTPDSVCQGNRDIIYLCNEIYSDEE